MTDNEKYQALLKEVGELLDNKNNRIAVLEWQLEQFKQKVAELESGKVCKTRIGSEGC